ncbi:MAG TPA: D-glycero-beta-D-manno-heptose 1-phosphate adenylyltransferase [Planctomycetes bacterium]|nr:D-glycero-beta-D-manno-heptose 1-phosphate adenylyltransferase [Planctomycetota bacterium]
MALVVKKKRSKDKIVKNKKTLAGILEGLKSQGKKVVLTNGCFDILHVGHARCLEDAKSRGDFLVVALNEDPVVTKLKGRGYPINPLEDRMELVASLTSVDYVTAFGDETADEILKLFKPTLYAKGTDYTERTVPERNTAKEVGAKIVIVGDKKSHATSKVVQKIRRRKFGA